MPKAIDRAAIDSALVAAVAALGAPTASEVLAHAWPVLRSDHAVREYLRALVRRGVLRARVGHREWPRQYGPGPTAVTSPVVYEVVIEVDSRQ